MSQREQRVRDVDLLRLFVLEEQAAIFVDPTKGMFDAHSFAVLSSRAATSTAHDTRQEATLVRFVAIAARVVSAIRKDFNATEADQHGRQHWSEEAEIGRVGRIAPQVVHNAVLIRECGYLERLPSPIDRIPSKPDTAECILDVRRVNDVML